MENDIIYNSNELQERINNLIINYPFLKTGSVGTSVLNNSIPYIKIGNGNTEIFYTASIHANEWITSSILMKFIKDFCFAYVNKSTIYGYSAISIFNNTSIYIVPMSNPDGVNLVTGEIFPGSSAYNQAKQIASSFPSIPFPNGWKANIRGVDLNLQFPARLE